MKKFLSIFLILAMLCTAVAFAESANVTGTWYGQTMTVQGFTMPLADGGLEITIELNADSTLSMTQIANGETLSAEGTWALNDEGNVVATVNEEDVIFPVVDGVLTIDLEGITITFGRDALEGFSTGEAIVAESVEAFNGSYTATHVDATGITLPMGEMAALGYDISFDVSFADGTMTLNLTLDGDVTTEALPMTLVNGILADTADGESTVTATLYESGVVGITMMNMTFYCEAQ